jgi:hypothetical protein
MKQKQIKTEKKTKRKGREVAIVAVLVEGGRSQVENSEIFCSVLVP